MRAANGAGPVLALAVPASTGSAGSPAILLGSASAPGHDALCFRHPVPGPPGPGPATGSRPGLRPGSRPGSRPGPRPSAQPGPPPSPAPGSGTLPGLRPVPRLGPAPGPAPSSTPGPQQPTTPVFMSQQASCSTEPMPHGANASFAELTASALEEAELRAKSAKSAKASAKSAKSARASNRQSYVGDDLEDILFLKHKTI